MFSLFKKKSNLPDIPKNTVCLNCDTMLTGDENFCPNCGQKNKNEKLTFGSFLHELFAGFTSWDTKFWNTIIPLVTKPGKVSKDYIEGKRMRYTNPFRFYLTTSIIFFLLIGAVESYSKFKETINGERKKTEAIIISDSIDSIAAVKTDSITKEALTDVKQTISELNKNLGTSIDTSEIKNTQKKGFRITVGDGEKINRILKFSKKYPDSHVNDALDSLNLENTFSNRFWYTRAGLMNSIDADPEKRKKFISQMVSYISVALFILLPLFTLFLKLVYIRKKFTYVEHLVFVFHLQTVFFLLAILFFLISLITTKAGELASFIFLILFLLYLYKAMRKFYEQNRLKTIVKFIAANTVFLVLAGYGTAAVAMVAFAFY